MMKFKVGDRVRSNKTFKTNGNQDIHCGMRGIVSYTFESDYADIDVVWEGFHDGHHGYKHNDHYPNSHWIVDAEHLDLCDIQLELEF